MTWYIADSFGSKENRFGDRIAGDDITEKTFNKYLVELNNAMKSKKAVEPTPATSNWIAELLLDTKNNPTSQAWITKYAGSNLNYLKDLNIAYNAVTQLGAVYTGGKYESLLKNRPRKSLNDELNLF